MSDSYSSTNNSSAPSQMRATPIGQSVPNKARSEKQSGNSNTKASDETASIASFSSTSGLLGNSKPKPDTAVDPKKLQKQALRSQIQFQV